LIALTVRKLTQVETGRNIQLAVKQIMLGVVSAWRL
jgi:hypothetical protein